MAAGDTFYQEIVPVLGGGRHLPGVRQRQHRESGCGTADSPGDYPESYGVGAHDIMNGIAPFSSRGASAFGGIIKPNITAPGVNVRSSVPGGGYDVVQRDVDGDAPPFRRGGADLVGRARPGG